jgi:UDP-N-acetylglucosamine transferase subunit ALG13
MTTLLVANDGGHAMQLHQLVPRLPIDDDPLWVTVPTPQTRALLRDERVAWMEPAVTRDWRAAARNAWRAASLFRTHEVRAAFSTGSSLAASVLPQARARRIPTFYVESVTRTEGPSMSGRLVASVPGMRVFTQWPQWQGRRWRFGGSVLDGYRATATEPRPVRRVVVSLGTSARYGFRRLVERLATVVPPDTEVLWQTGCTDVDGLGIDARPSVGGDELAAAIDGADAVVAHAGAGIALSAFEAGKAPVLVPRRAELGEHVDDHQWQIAGVLAARRLAVVRDADHLEWDDLAGAAATAVVRVDRPPPFALDGDADGDHDPVAVAGPAAVVEPAR